MSSLDLLFDARRRVRPPEGAAQPLGISRITVAAGHEPARHRQDFGVGVPPLVLGAEPARLVRVVAAELLPEVLGVAPVPGHVVPSHAASSACWVSFTMATSISGINS